LLRCAVTSALVTSKVYDFKHEIRVAEAYFPHTH